MGFLTGSGMNKSVVLLQYFDIKKNKKKQLVYSSMLARSDILPAPITTKEEDNLENDKFRLGVSGMQGWRRRMEDAHLNLLNLSKTHPNHSFFGMFIFVI